MKFIYKKNIYMAIAFLVCHLAILAATGRGSRVYVKLIVISLV